VLNKFICKKLGKNAVNLY